MSAAASLIVAVDVQLRAALFALIAIKDSQRDAHAEPDVLVDGRVAADIETEDRIGGSIGYGEPVIGLRLVDRLQ